MTAFDDPTATEEAFAELGNEVRLRVLAALSDALRDGEGALAFSDLRDRVGYEDDGNFGYHLERLRESFVRKTEDGYVLQARGLDVVGTMFAGALADGDHQTATVDSECLFCDAPLLVEYATGALVVRCRHGHAVLSNIYPADGAGHGDIDRLVDVVGTTTAHQLELARDGVCANCYGEMEPRIEAGDVMEYRFRAPCTRCGMQYTAPVGMAFTRHPAVVAFYHRHDRDPTEERLWELELSRPEAVARRSNDPVRFAVTVTLDDESLELALDDEARVVRSERTACTD